MKIICIGKIKEKYLKDGIEKFLNLIKKYEPIEIIEIIDEKIPNNPSIKEENKIIEKEGNKILNKIYDNDFVVALCIEGSRPSTYELSHKLKDKKNITFVIGGSLGLSQAIKNRANYKISFSNMTFPHQLMRLILLEQINSIIKKD